MTMAFKHRIALGATLLLMLTEVGMASSLLLPSPGQLAGDWKLYRATEPTAACTVHLQAPETLLTGDLDCVERVLGARATAWLVTPDTLALVGGDGVVLRHFNRVTPDLYEWGFDADKAMRLERLELP